MNGKPFGRKGANSMWFGGPKITVFKIKNRTGYAAICEDHLTEGRSKREALERMEKALKRRKKTK
jgi:hypothetical protein